MGRINLVKVLELTIHFYAIINPALQTKNDFQSSIHERE